MKKIVLIILVFVTPFINANAQEEVNEKMDDLSGQVTAIDERLLIAESDLFKLTKIKVSGYIQAQFEDFQSDLVKSGDAYNSFSIRRARVKFSYVTDLGTHFVLQPDFSTSKVTLKDAYVVVNEPWLNVFKLWLGQFNRLNYEVEYSSSQREIMERSKLIRTIYAGEREIGAKLEFVPINAPIKMQVAAFNGNFATGTEAKDIDTRKDIMARAVYSLVMPNAGVAIDFGAHFYYGGLKAKAKYVNDFENKLDSVSYNKGSYLDKKWFGAEIQMFFDFLGGTSLKG